jgi:amidase
MAAGRYTSRQLVELYLRRIDDIDRGGPALRSIARSTPTRCASPTNSTPNAAARSAWPAARIPIVVKDNIETGDRMATTAGSLALEGTTAPRDAFVVERLRAAGAVISARPI